MYKSVFSRVYVRVFSRVYIECILSVYECIFKSVGGPSEKTDRRPQDRIRQVSRTHCRYNLSFKKNLILQNFLQISCGYGKDLQL